MYFDSFNQIHVNFRAPDGKGHQRLAMGVHRLFLHCVISERYSYAIDTADTYCVVVLNFNPSGGCWSPEMTGLWYLDSDDDTVVVSALSFSSFLQTADVVSLFIPTLWQDCSLGIIGSKHPVNFWPCKEEI